MIILKFLNVFVCISNSSPFIADEYFIVWRYHNLFTHYPADGHLSSFQAGSTTNKAAMKIYKQVFTCPYAFFPLRSRTTGFCGRWICNILKTVKLFSNVVVLFYFPINRVWELKFLCFSPTFDMVSLLNFNLEWLNLL